MIAAAPALPLHTAGPYVAAAYIVFVAVILIYVAIMAVRLTRTERDLARLRREVDDDRVRREEHDMHAYIRFRERPAEAGPARGRTDVQPLHLARSVGQPLQRDRTRYLAVEPRDE